MKNCFRVIGTALALLMTGVVSASQAENPYLEWYHSHYDEFREMVQKCLEKKSLSPWIMDGPTDVYLAENPVEIRKGEQFDLVITMALLEQEESSCFALFFIRRECLSQDHTTILVYTASDQKHMPSMKLYLDVMNHPQMQKKKLPKDYCLHIQDLDVHKGGGYSQAWIFYNDKEKLKIPLSFAPDGKGGTKFTFN